MTSDFKQKVALLRERIRMSVYVSDVAYEVVKVCDLLHL